MTAFKRREVSRKEADALPLDGKADSEIITFKNATARSDIRVLRDGESGALVIYDPSVSVLMPKAGDVLAIVSNDRFEHVAMLKPLAEWQAEWEPVPPDEGAP